MSTPANALTGPVWVDAEGNGFTSADGGKTFTPVTLGTGGLPAGTGLVKVTSGTGSLATAYTDYLPGGDWFATEALAMKTALPSITAAVPIQLGVSNETAIIGANVSDANKEGGALQGTGAGWGLLTKATVWQNPKTSIWACTFQASLPTIVAAHSGFIGVTDSPGTHQIVIGTDTTRSATNFLAFAYDGTSTGTVLLGTADTAVHTWRMYSDGTTVTIYLDGTSVGTILTSATHFPVLPAYPGLYCAAGSVGMGVYRCIYGSVAP